MKKIILAIIALLFFSVPLYAQEDDEDEALYEAKERVEEARQRIDEILERRKRNTGGNPLLESYYNHFEGNTELQNAMALYQISLQEYQMELEAAKIRKERRNIKRKQK